MPNFDISALAQEFLRAHTTGEMFVSPPSTKFADFDLNAAYAVESELVSLRKQAGHQTAGLKVGYANKAIWRILKLETLVWAHIYDDTVHYADGNDAELALPFYRSPKIEPEIVFRLKHPIAASGLEAATLLENIDWLAVGFEIIDCPFPDWQFKPADFVAAFGLHLALVIGPPRTIEPGRSAELASALASFKIRVSRDGQFVEEGAGKNSLRSPALCLAELAGALLRQPGASPLAAGDLVSSGTLTTGHPAARDETWQVAVDGLPLSGLTLQLR